MELTTRRLRLIPATAETIRAEIEDHAELGKLLNAEIPDAWPPEMLADALPWFLSQFEAKPDLVGWLGWYAIRIETTPALLVGSAGFMGLPKEGEVEIGYSVLPQFQRQGVAREMVTALIDWVLDQPGVERVVAEIHHENTPSLSLINSLGFLASGPGKEPDHQRFHHSRPNLS